MGVMKVAVSLKVMGGILNVWVMAHAYKFRAGSSSEMP
jgi:hypothetical protein